MQVIYFETKHAAIVSASITGAPPVPLLLFQSLSCSTVFENEQDAEKGLSLTDQTYFLRIFFTDKRGQYKRTAHFNLEAQYLICNMCNTNFDQTWIKGTAGEMP
jgi:hypothetical protein